MKYWAPEVLRYLTREGLLLRLLLRLNPSEMHIPRHVLQDVDHSGKMEKDQTMEQGYVLSVPIFLSLTPMFLNSYLNILNEGCRFPSNVASPNASYLLFQIQKQNHQGCKKFKGKDGVLMCSAKAQKAAILKSNNLHNNILELMKKIACYFCSVSPKEQDARQHVRQNSLWTCCVGSAK